MFAVAFLRQCPRCMSLSSVLLVVVVVVERMTLCLQISFMLLRMLPFG